MRLIFSHSEYSIKEASRPPRYPVNPLREQPPPESILVDRLRCDACGKILGEFAKACDCNRDSLRTASALDGYQNESCTFFLFQSIRRLALSL